ncbi:MAG: phenylacetate-CoA oxygenase subunit PaaJ [Bacteroidetes bacterium]|nr:phenylacetate-CoA oxygenase subunit PaaJ [Bacteroidota bacterium]
MVKEKEIWKALEEVMDPEIPTISMVDLGIVTSVQTNPDENSAAITLIPTFSGCPALRIMEDMVREKVESLGVDQVKVSTNFDIPWTTERITEKGRKALLQHGLAPPPENHGGLIELNVLSDVACPYCGSRNTRLTTPFGPTLCRSMHYCDNCLQAFEQFKPVG